MNNGVCNVSHIFPPLYPPVECGAHLAPLETSHNCHSYVAIAALTHGCRSPRDVDPVASRRSAASPHLSALLLRRCASASLRGVGQKRCLIWFPPHKWFACFLMRWVPACAGMTSG